MDTADLELAEKSIRDIVKSEISKQQGSNRVSKQSNKRKKGKGWKKSKAVKPQGQVAHRSRSKSAQPINN